MAGLGSAMQQQGPAPEAEDEGEVPTGNEASPEEQAIYDQVVNNALEIIYPQGEEALAPQIRESLTAGDKPVMNLALAAVAVVSGLVASAKQANQPIPGEVLFHAGAQIVELLAEAAEAFKLADYSDEDIERAFYIASDMYREQAKASGDLDEEALKADFAELEKANEEGRIEEMLPGAVEHAQKTTPQAGEEPPVEEEEEEA